MKNQQSGTIWMGVGLIVFGIIFGVAMITGWEKAWPAMPLAGGLALWLGYFLSGARDGGLALMGTGGILVGLFFFWFTLGYGEWSDMGGLWPVWPIIGGVAFLVGFLAERRTRKDPGLLGVGLAAIVVGVVAFAIKAGTLPGDISKYWPVLIILVGVLALVSGLFSRSRKA